MSIYLDEVQAQIRELEEQIHGLKFQITDREDQIERLKVGTSPIKVGDIIRWESGKTLRRGRVQSIGGSWRGFDYRCVILGKTGKELGWANVHSDKCPMLEDDDEGESVPNAAQVAEDLLANVPPVVGTGKRRPRGSDRGGSKGRQPVRGKTAGET